MRRLVQRGIFRNATIAVASGICVFVLAMAIRSSADEQPPAADASPLSAPPADAGPGKTPPAPPNLPLPKDARQLSKTYPIWIAKSENAVIVGGQIALREGMLEMFSCTRNTKEHESIVSANTKAWLVHTALMALGAEPGHPVRYEPEFLPPTGTEIDVYVRWIDDKGKLQTARAQDWITDIKTHQSMTYPFVFAGSGFYTDPDTNKQYYQAEHGDFVCVANFGTAMLDIPVRSSKSNEELEFEANTKKIPPLGTPVQLVFKPKLKKQAGSEKRLDPQGSGERRSTK